MVINIYCKLKKASYNIFFHQSSNGEISLYTLRLSSGYNDLLNSENLKVAIAQLCHDIVVGGRLDQRSINRRCHGTIAFGH